ncbi:hypothetical protein JNK13_03540 [bacterium]|nr:hypothetical protein [bacterium]
MSMIKRLQIPIAPGDEHLLKSAAKREGISLAEWARRHLRDKALSSIGECTTDNKKTALMKLFSQNAPVSDVDTMIKESFKRRYK